MIIDDSKNQTAYGNLEAGECFRFQGDIYIKTKDNDGNNSVDLASGELHYCYDDDEIEKINAKLIIE